MVSVVTSQESLDKVYAITSDAEALGYLFEVVEQAFYNHDIPIPI